MLTDDAFSLWCQAIALPDEGRACVRQIRASDPVRAVQNRRSNVRGKFASRKMGHTIAFESLLELGAIWEMEHDPDVLEYWDQPAQLKLNYVLPSGKRGGHRYTPDFLVIRQDRALFVEWKHVKDLRKLVDDRPHEYTIDTEGAWRCPPADHAAQKHHLGFAICDEHHLHPTYRRNLEFLDDYLRPDCPDVPPAIADAVMACVAEDVGLSLLDLLQNLPAGATADHVYRLVATDILITNLRTCVLAVPRHVPLFPDAIYAEAWGIVGQEELVSIPASLVALRPQQQLVWDGRLWTVVNAGDTTVTLQAEEKTLMDLSLVAVEKLVGDGRIHASEPNTSETSQLSPLRTTHPKALAEAVARYHQIQPYLEGTKSERPTRNEYRWIRAWQEAKASGGSGLLALAPRTAFQGRATPRLPEGNRALMREFIERYYQHPKQLTGSMVWALYAESAQKAGFAPASEKTFRKELQTYTAHEHELARRGKRAAYNHQRRQTDPNPLPAHGDRPWQKAYMDHTQIDEELVSAVSGKPMKKRPWLTLVVDGYSRRPLSQYLTFDPPSSVSCLMALRRCVQRHHRLPDSVVVDNGKEFSSTAFEQFLALHEMHKLDRPPGEPRFGAVVERMFGVINETFFHLLLGNTQIMTLVRQMTRSHDPRQQTVWTFEQLDHMLDKWVFELYDDRPHPALGMSPKEMYDRGLQLGGTREHRFVPYDVDFILSTLPTPGRHPTVQRDGIRFQYFDYWCDEFRKPDIEGTALPLRYDPFDMGCAYAYVHGRWERLTVAGYQEFMNSRTERELHAITEEIRERDRQHQRDRRTITAQMIVTFYHEIENVGTVARQQLLDREQNRAPAFAEAEGTEDPIGDDITDDDTHDDDTNEHTLDPRKLEPGGEFRL